MPRSPTEQNVAAAENDLVRALEAEAESLRKLNPFLVLGVGYETTDGDVRAAFGELTKRYHPDRFARYQSTQLRQIAAEIFILIRDAYRKLADEASRAQVHAAIGPKTTPRAASQARPQAAPPQRPTPPPIAKVPPAPPKPPRTARRRTRRTTRRPIQALRAPRSPAPSSQSPTRSRRRCRSSRARPLKTPPRGTPAVTTPMPASQPLPLAETRRAPTAQPVVDNNEASGPDLLIDEGKLDEALAAYR